MDDIGSPDDRSTPKLKAPADRLNFFNYNSSLPESAFSKEVRLHEPINPIPSEHRAF